MCRVRLVRSTALRLVQEGEELRVHYSTENTREYHEAEEQWLEVGEYGTYNTLLLLLSLLFFLFCESPLLQPLLCALLSYPFFTYCFHLLSFPFPRRLLISPPTFIFYSSFLVLSLFFRAHFSSGVDPHSFYVDSQSV